MTTTTPSPGRGFYMAVMAAGLVLSMAGNAVHVWSQWHVDVAAGVDRGSVSVWVPTVAIMLAPAMLLVMTEAIVIAHQRNRGRVRLLVTALAAIVGVVALAVSYAGLVYVCRTIIGLPPALAYAAPLIVDVPIVAATIGLWDVVDQARGKGPAQPAATPPAHLVTEPAQPAHPATGPAAAPLVHPAAEFATSPAQPAMTPMSPQVSGYVRAVASLVAEEPPHPVSPDPAQPVGAKPAHLAADLVTEPPHPVTADPAHLVAEPAAGPAAEELAHLVAGLAVTEPAQPVALAARLVAERGLDAAPAVVADVLAARAEGTPWSQVADVAGRSASTVRRWVDAAADLDAEYAVSVGRTQRTDLVAVGES